MDNSVQQSAPSIQPPPQPQIITTAPQSTNWVKILLFAILSLITVTVSVYAGIQIGKNQSISQQPVIAQPTPLSTQTITPSYTSPTQTSTTPTTKVNCVSNEDTTTDPSRCCSGDFVPLSDPNKFLCLPKTPNGVLY